MNSNRDIDPFVIAQTERTKRLAYKLDHDCWLSQAPEIELPKYISVRRLDSLIAAYLILANPEIAVHIHHDLHGII